MARHAGSGPGSGLVDERAADRQDGPRGGRRLGALGPRVRHRAGVPRPTGASDEPSMLLSRLLDTGIGIAVGLLVNGARVAAAARPQRRPSDRRLDDRIGELLAEMAEG